MNKQYKVKPWYTDPKEANLSAQDVQDMLNFSVECGAKGVEYVEDAIVSYSASAFSLTDSNYWGLNKELETYTGNIHCGDKTKIKEVSSLQELKDLFSEGIEQETEELVVEDRYKFLEGVGDTELRVIELLLINYNKTSKEDSCIYTTDNRGLLLFNEYLVSFEDSFGVLINQANCLGIENLLTKEELTQLQNKTKIEALAVSIKSQQEELDKLKQGLNCGTNL